MKQANNESYKAVVVLEEAQTELQRLLSKMITDFIQRQIVGRQAQDIIDKCISDLRELKVDNAFITKAEIGLKSSFTRWYNQTLTQLLYSAKIKNNPLFILSYKQITGITPKETSKAMIINLSQIEGFETGTVENIRDYFTTGEKGYSQMFIDDYQKRVNEEINNIANRNVVLRDKANRRMSVRNLAEMEVRFQELKKDEQLLKAKGIDYAYATSHSNASKRCSIWQGKLFYLDGSIGSTRLGQYIEGYTPKPIGKIDGIDYYSLADAIHHGFLGYNCRHRMIAYKKGMTAPREYPARFIDIERNREQYLRSLENKIRHAKRNYALAQSKEERNYFKKQSAYLQDVYKSKCKQYDYPIAEWRTRVSQVERNNLPVIQNKTHRLFGDLKYDFSNEVGDYNKKIILTYEREKHIMEEHKEMEYYIHDLIKYINNPADIKPNKKDKNSKNIIYKLSNNEQLFITVKFAPKNGKRFSSIISARYMTTSKKKKR